VKRTRLTLAGIAILVLALPTAAAATVNLSSLDESAYPTIRTSVVSGSPTSQAPALSENGMPVTGFEAQNLGRSKTIALLIDRSQSMRGAPLRDAIAAARSFVREKQSSDEIAVIAFGSQSETLSPSSTSGVDSLVGLDQIRPDPFKGTALYDSVISGARQLGANPLPGRVIIVLTDGADNASRKGLTAAITAAREANAAVYAIGIAGKGFTPDPLRKLSTATGGQYFVASSTSALASVYATIGDTLRRTWRVQYETSARPGDRISVKASLVGEGSAVTSLTVTGPHGTSTAKSLLPKGFFGPGGPFAIAVAVAVLVLFAALFFLAGIRGSWVRSRISAHVGESKTSSKGQRKQRRSEALASLFAATERAFGNLKQWRWLSRMLERADVPLRTVEFFWISVAAALGMAMFAFALGVSPMFGVVLVVVGGGAPFAWVWFKMRKRMKAFEDQLPDFLVTIAASLKAGHSFKQGLNAVVEEGQPPASQEIKRVLTETSLGRQMDDALADMAERVGSKNFEFAITAVTIQRQVGGSLATLFDMVGDMVRQRQQFARKIKALTAMGRMSAYTLIGIPFFIAGVFTLINRSYMRPLYFSHTGHVLILIGLCMMVFGSLILKKIVSFKG
jgi:tight adherence protein B